MASASVGGPAFENYKRTIYRRIQLAAAVFVIRSTPQGKSPRAHAADVQEKLRTLWLNSPLLSNASKINVCAQEHILTHHQNVLSSTLCSLVPSNFKDYCPRNGCDDDAHRRQMESSTVQVQLHDLIVNRDKLRDSANFVQAVVQLKALAEFHVTIPSESYVRSISKLSGLKKEVSSTLNDFEPQSSLSLSWNDYGFYSADQCNQFSSHCGGNAPVTNVASSILLYIVNSCNADQLLKKTVWRILNQLKTVSCECVNGWSVLSLVETMNHWTGSVYQQAVSVLRSAIDSHVTHMDSSIHDLCLSFIQEIIVQIVRNRAIRETDYFIREYQIVMILKISEGTNLWFNSLEYILSYLTEHTDSIRSKHAYLCQAETSIASFHPRKEFLKNCFIYFQEVDESVILLVLERTFLTLGGHNVELVKSKVSHTPSHPNQSSGQQKKNSIAGLWRKYHNIEALSVQPQEDTADRVSEKKSRVRHWKQVLEESFGPIMFERPLIAILAWECIQLLQCFDQ